MLRKNGLKPFSSWWSPYLTKNGLKPCLVRQLNRMGFLTPLIGDLAVRVPFQGVSPQDNGSRKILAFAMAQVLSLLPPYRNLRRPSPTSPRPSSHPTPNPTCDTLRLQRHNPNPRWTTLKEQLKCQGRHSCLFSDGRKQEEARKALESALGGKKMEFEKWNKEIEKREKMGGGGTSGRGGWFGGGGWFGWFEGEHFWEEAQQACLVIIGIVFLYLLITKGNVMFAVVFNSLLFALRGTRNWLTVISSQLSGRISPSMPLPDQTVRKITPPTRNSAKESVIRKWGTD